MNAEMLRPNYETDPVLKDLDREAYGLVMCGITLSRSANPATNFGWAGRFRFGGGSEPGRVLRYETGETSNVAK
jgi:hypothetical protein